MKQLYQVILYTLLPIFVSGQAYVDFVTIKDHRESTVLIIKGQESGRNIFESYGNISLSSKLADFQNRYLYQSQEYEMNLGVYLFPARIYSGSKKCFFQPDPKSQYYSPYLFVGSDPINYVDFTGEEGKPLILYGEDYNYDSGMDDSFLDLKSQVGDAHYMPLSDFVNNDVTNLSEWNGNVFIESHAGLEEGSELGAEFSPREGDLKLIGKEGVNFKAGETQFMTGVDAKKIGSKLRALAAKNKVPVKNVVVGGCKGSLAAKNVGKGYAEAGSMEGRTIRTYGLRKELKSAIYGQRTRETAGVASDIRPTRYYVANSEAKIRYKPVTRDGNRIYEPAAYTEQGSEMPMRYVEGEQINEMANGTIPRRLSRNFEAFTFDY